MELVPTQEELKTIRFNRRERDILNAAMSLVRQRDPQWITVEQIARAAGVGKGTIYKHFSSREDLFAAIVCEFYEEIVAHLKRIEPDQSVLDRLQAAMWVFWDGHRVEVEMRRIVLYTDRPDFRAALDAVSMQRLERSLTGLRNEFESILRRGVENGVFGARPLHLMANALIATLNGSVRLLWVEPDRSDDEEFRSEVTRFILAGMMRHDRR